MPDTNAVQAQLGSQPERQRPTPTAYHLRVDAEEVSVVELCSRFWRHAGQYYRKPDGSPGKELHHFTQAFKPLKKLYGRTPAIEFGPLALRTVREEMVKIGWCRRHVNFQVSRIKRMFRWATENELLPGSVYHALQAVAGLRRGRSGARESDPVKPVPMEDVEAVTRPSFDPILHQLAGGRSLREGQRTWAPGRRGTP